MTSESAVRRRWRHRRYSKFPVLKWFESMPHQSDLYSRWSREVRREGFFRAGDRVGVAVSGGPDSVLLLDFMSRLASDLGLGLAVVHFNHRLRGAESDADEQFVRQLAEERGLEFLSGSGNVAEEARQKRQNVEAVARRLRYRFFFSLVHQGRVSKVATAHTANDQAETVLLKLLRGAGPRGLAGIYPVLEGKVVRPFLSLTRPEIERELARRKLEFRTDPSNRDLRLRRNQIRHELLPRLEREFNPEIVPLLRQLAERARQDEAYLDEQAREHARPWRVREGKEERIPVRSLLGLPAALVPRVLQQMIQAAGGKLRGTTYGHLEALRRFAREAQSGRALALPGGLEARREFDWLAIGPAHAEAAPANFSYPVRVPGEVFVPELGRTFQFKIVGSADFGKAYNNVEVAALDSLRLSGGLRLRNWRAGDRFRPPGSRKAWKLKELFRRRRIPAGQRRLWPVLEKGKEIVWVRGFAAAGPAVSLPSSQVLIVEERASASAQVGKARIRMRRKDGETKAGYPLESTA